MKSFTYKSILLGLICVLILLAGLLISLESASADTINPGDYCLTFSSPAAFSIDCPEKCWNGTMYYSTDKSTWTLWPNGEISAASGAGGTTFYTFVVFPIELCHLLPLFLEFHGQ